MQKTNLNRHGVIALVSLAKIINPIIGDYKEHYINENFDFQIKLTNGTIGMSKENAEDYESDPNNVKQSRIIKIANTFREFIN